MRRLRLIAVSWKRVGVVPLAVLACLSAVASAFAAAPPNDAFASAIQLSGLWGSAQGSNVGATSEASEPSHAGLPANASIWYKWTAPVSGEVSIDTLGSTSATGFSLDTVLAVYTGPDLAHLNQVAANDDIYPMRRPVFSGRFRFTGTPFNGPSEVRFNATSGTTYYIAIDTKFLPGNTSLNWAYHSSGSFRFASEDINPSTGGALYQVSEQEDLIDDQSTFETYYIYDPQMALVTITRVGGSAGRVVVNYKTADLTDTTQLYDPSWDMPAVAGQDYVPLQGQIVFDDFETSKTIGIPIISDFFQANSNRDFAIIITGVTNAASESTEVSQPRVDPFFGSAIVRILDMDIDPFMQANIQADTNGNIVAFMPTNSIFNFTKAHFRVPEDVNDYYTNSTAGIWVERHGTNNEGVTLNYRINNYLGVDQDIDEEDNNLFPLQPGSDYATPTPPNSLAINGLSSDFILAQGTLSWGQNDFTPKRIPFTITNDTITEFNEDFHVFLYREVDNGPRLVGTVNEATVTILFDDKDPPAGSVDQLHNADHGDNMKPPVLSNPRNQDRPGADGIVWDMALLPGNQAILAGQFGSYNSVGRNGIARVNQDGSLDPTFYPGSGADDLISSLALQTDGHIIIGGAFTHYDGADRKSISRINSGGSLDPTFDPGQGADGAVWAVTLQGDGRVLIAGDFLNFNGVPRAHIARLNTDGSLDASFDPGANSPNGTIWTIALQTDGKVVIGGTFTALGTQPIMNLARLNTNGSADTAFNASLGIGVDGTVFSLALQPGNQILVGGDFHTINVTPRTRFARLNNTGVVDMSFDPGSGANDTVYRIDPQPSGQIYVGGLFTSFNGTHRLGFTRLFADATVDTSFLDTAYDQFAGLHRRYYDKQSQPGDPAPDPRPFVFTSVVQDDGNVLIGGGFNQVGGGQADAAIRSDADFPTNQFNLDVWTEPKARDGVRNRSNFARLLGGSTPGPGNISLSSGTYQANRSQSYVQVGVTRQNGNLGYLSANLSVLPGLAQSGVDYVYYNTPPLYLSTWRLDIIDNATYLANVPGATTRMHSDGIFGNSAVPTDILGHSWFGYTPGQVTTTVSIRNSGIPGTVTTSVQLANPSGDDQFYLGGENIPLGGALGSAVAPFSVVDDSRLTNALGFASATFTVNEVATNAVITVVRTNGFAGTVSVQYSTTDGTAVAGSNYVAVSGRLSFPPGVTNQTFTVPIKDDFISEPNGMAVNLRLSSASGAVLGLSTATLRIIDGDFAPGYLTFSSPTYTTNETSGAVVLTVNRNGSSKGTVTVQCGTANGTAVAGINYVATTNTLTWNDLDSTPRFLTVPLINNGQVGPNTSFKAVLFNATVNTTNSTSVLSSSPTSATVTIVDDNLYGNLQFSQPSYTVNENGGSATITVVRNGGASQALSVNYATSDGTAVSRGTVPNYIATSGTLIFNPGVVMQSFSVPLLDDGIVDPTANNFFFSVALSGLTPAGASLGYLTNVPVFIRDAESYNVPPGEPDTTFNPLPGFDGDILSLALQANGQIIVAGGFTTANSSPRNHIARLNSDATLDPTFLSGLSGANGPVNAVRVQSDNRVLAGGTFTSVDGVNRNRLVRLLQDGSLDSSFNPGAGADNAVFAIAESFNPDRRVLVGGGFITVNGFTHPGLARLNNDGTLDGNFDPALNVNGTVYAIAVYPTNSIQAGKIVIGGSFTAVDGVGYNSIARLNANGTLDSSFNPGSGASDAVRAIALQLDGRIVIGGAFTNFNGNLHTHIARLNLDGSVDSTFNAAPGPDDTVLDIKLQADNRIVVVGQFLRANGVSRSRITRLMPDGTVDPSINFGLGSDGFISSLAIQPDGMLVIGGGFSKFDGIARSHLARLYGGSIAGSGSFEFTTGNFIADENSTNVTITVRRRGGTSGNMTVNFATADGTAHAGVNYSNVTAVLSFPNGETLQQVSVPVIDDFQITTDLVANLVLSSPLPPSALGDQPVATLTILNDDSGISFAATAYRVNENVTDGLAAINVTRQGSVRGTASVVFMTTTNGTALPGFNFTPVTNTLVFQPGQSNLVVDVPVLATPGVVEGDVTVTMLLTNANRALLFTPSQATLTIVDVDQAPGLFYFGQTNYVVNEDAGYVLLTVIRTNGHTGVVNLNFTTINGSAIAGVKYTATNGVLTFQDGEISKVIAVQILNTNFVTGDQTFFVSISGAGGSTANILGPNTVPVTIIDNNNIGVGFSSPIYIATETDGSVTVNVNRVGTNGFTTVSFTTTNGTATAGTNYVPRAGTLTFNPGETVKGLSIGLIHDPRVTGPVSFNILLFNPSAPARIFTNNPATIVINDADPGLAFTNANFYATKSDTNGTVLISVLRSNANTGIVSVNFSTFDGTALAGQDYFPTNGLLTFSNGIALQSFSVRIISNNIVAPDRSFFVSIFNPTFPAQILEPSTATVTITNDLTGLSFSSPNYQVNENGGQANITVVRSGFTNSTVSVSYSTADGTGKAGINYSNVTGVLVFTNGETAKTFAVPVKSDSAVTGDKTVQLELSALVGHVVPVQPQAALLTILETDGSQIVGAGTALQSESGPVNGNLDPGETVTVLFALRNSAGTNTVNLIATLLPTNGVSNPSGPQAYGALTVHGPSVSRPFTFTANATNGQIIQATFRLTDGTAPTNFVAFTFVVGQTTMVYSNAASIVINDNTTASPYPSAITVSSLPGQVIKATATFTNLSHESPSDIDALLVSPAGQKSLLMAHCGSDITVNNITLTFDDAASASLPQSSQLVSGTYRPTSFSIATPPFPPAQTPAPPYANTMSAFNGANPNGNWSLYIIDDLQPYAGVISNGWLLKLTTATPLLGNSDLGVAMTASSSSAILSSNLTYVITVTNYGPAAASNIVVSDPLPVGVTYLSSSASLGTTSTNAAGQLVWNIPSLAVGGYGSLTLVVRPNVVGLLTNTVSVTNAVADLNPEDDTASATVSILSPTADLAISVSGSPNSVLTGNSLTYTIIVTNSGPATATSVSVTDTLPPGVAFVSASPVGYVLNGNQVTFANLGDLGSSGQVTATIVVRPNIGGTLTNTVTVTSGIVDPFKLNNTAAVKNIVVPVTVTLSHNGANLVFSWPAQASGYYLESTTSMHPPVIWTQVNGTPVNVNGQMTLTVPVGSGTVFFRLHGQAQ